MRQWFLIVSAKLPGTNFHQRDRLSEFFSNLAVAAAAITILPAIIGVDTLTPTKLLSGLVIGAILLGASLVLLGDKYAD